MSNEQKKTLMSPSPSLLAITTMMNVIKMAHHHLLFSNYFVRLIFFALQIVR